MKRLLPLLTPIALLLLLPGCGLRPLYASGDAGPVASSLSSVEVGPIGGQRGWLVRNALNDRLHRQGEGATRYRLEVELDDDISGFGVRQDNAITRERRILRARYRLIDAATGGVLLDQTAMADAGIDVAGSEYATAAAEQTALERLTEGLADQIVARLATYAGRSAGQ
ncbi:LPS assembly lipoprotein LptE [Sphingomonas sp. SRS2]|uniref:LPS assembly lipoprotein LptE n=1 Tax=Sphingomonas sp. SRS2 TaxID=133190 RepID=UPI0006183F9A|nr:LPS assembly lipoprotein LptE [Sphingomonas sp. SRS2]KKC26526.1 secreted (periplasmic)-like protein [Sphingomonas sp. SRS2]